MIATIQSQLPASADQIWRSLQRTESFRYITRGLLGFQGMDDWPEHFAEGMEIETRLFFFHAVPGWTHRLRVVRIDHARRELESEEGGGLVRKWNHRIAVEPLGEDRCLYTDEINIDAGWLTPAVWAYAHAFYRYRQQRWRQLAKEPAVATQRGDDGSA